MPKFIHTQPHKLDAEEARKRVSKLIDDLKSSFGSAISNVESKWVDNTLEYSFKVMGSNITGNVEVMPDNARLSVVYPIFFAMYSSTLESTIRKKAAELLA